MSQQTVVTHDGTFHADEVFAVAALQLYYGTESLQIIRSREEATITAADIVVDVGGEYDVEHTRFDHHQAGAPVRENGIPYAAFGLVWKHYGTDICESRNTATAIETRLVQPIDAGDTGVALYTLNAHQVAPFELFHVLYTYKPLEKTAEKIDAAFMEALEFARNLLQRIISHEQYNQALIERAEYI